MIMIATLNDHMNIIVACTILVIILLNSISRNNPLIVNIWSRPNPSPPFKMEVDDNGKIQYLRIHVVTTGKCICNVLTCIAIMAVDFPPIFNRKLCKTEEEGWALMDVGVSSLMYSAALSHRLIIQHPSRYNKTFLQDITAAITGNLGITIAASVRFFLLSGVEYHGHVTEWGVHWNFFATIACLNILGCFIRSSKYCLLYAFIILLASEFVSQGYDLKSYILFAPRTDWISANREGVCSVLGYFSM